MREDLIKEKEPGMLAISAGAAVLVHALVFFGFTKISMEQSAYAIGNHGTIEMVLAAPATNSSMAEIPSIPQPPPEPVKIPTEFKKQSKRKPIAKKVVQEVPLTPIEKSIEQGTSTLNSLSTGKAAGDPNGNSVRGNARAEPDYLNNPPPRYPNESRRRHEEGMVLILASINPTGRVDSLVLSKGSGFERLDDAAMAAVKDWRFKPARFAGIAIDSNVEIPIRFSLR